MMITDNIYGATVFLYCLVIKTLFRTTSLFEILILINHHFPSFKSLKIDFFSF